MARRSSKAEAVAIAALIAFSAIGATVKWATENWTVIVTLLLALGGIAIVVASNSSKQAQARRASLQARYGDEEIVDRILTRTIWQGETEDQLTESLGRPHVVDKQLLKSKTRDVWKYDELKRGQFRLRITLENGRVVGWNRKG